MSVKRLLWEECDVHNCHCDVIESKDGDMVNYEDYASLLKERDALLVDNSGLKSSIVNIQGAIELACSAVNDDRRGDVFRDILNAIYIKTAVETPTTDAALLRGEQPS